MGMNVLSLFDGMSCGHLGLDKSNTEIDNYVASEVKEFAISHTAKKYPGTIQAGDVTRLHYEDGKMYRNCNRLVVTNGASVLSEADYQANKSCFFTKDGIRLVNITGLTFDKDFDTNNQILANYKDAGLILNASTLNDEALAFYQNNGFEILPNGEIAKWELGEMVFDGTFDMLIGGSPCFTADTLVLTNDGYKKIIDVVPGDYVYTHNHRYMPVDRIGHNYKKDIYELKAMGILPILATPNHPFYVSTKTRKYNNSIRRYEYSYSSPEKKRLDNLVKGEHFLCSPIISTEENPLNLTKEECFLLGRYVADGCTCKMFKADAINITIGNKKIKEFCSNVPSIKMYKNKSINNCTSFVIIDKKINTLIRSLPFGNKAIEKNIPMEILNLPKDLLLEFLNGYMLGDGCYIEKTYNYQATTVSKILAINLALVVQKLFRIGCGLYYTNRPKTHVIEGRTVNQHDTYMIRFCKNDKKQKKYIVKDNYILYPIHSIEDKKYQDTVYNIEVREDHTYVVPNCIVGNCQDFSLASAANGGKYGLEGSKSRLFFDYLRLKNEVNPTYFFLENVQMKSESKDMLDSFLGVHGIPLNSNKLSIQHRPRIYWTNLCDQAPVSDKTPEEIDFQNYKLRTLDRLEWGMYVKRFPGSYVGYAEGTQEANKGGFEFDETITEHTKVSDNGTMEGTKACIREHVRWNLDGTPNLSFTEEEASEIANFPQNRWVRKELETLYSRPVTDREIVEEIHRNLFEAIVKKSPSRDGMRYGKEVNGKKFSHCKDITNESKMSCITRKQDRFPNSGLIEFGPYCRFITKLEICKGQTVDYAFLADLSYEKIQDVCGDGWTVDVIASFFKHIGCTPIPLQTIEKPQKETEDNKTMGRRKTLVSDIFNESELEKETIAASSIKEDETTKSLPFTTNFDGMNISSEEVLNAIQKVLGMEALSKVQQELFGWDKIKQVNKSNVPSFVKESIEQEVKEALLGSYITKEIREKALWIIQGN